MIDPLNTGTQIISEAKGAELVALLVKAFPEWVLSFDDKRITSMTAEELVTCIRETHKGNCGISLNDKDGTLAGSLTELGFKVFEYGAGHGSACSLTLDLNDAERTERFMAFLAQRVTAKSTLSPDHATQARQSREESGKRRIG